MNSGVYMSPMGELVLIMKQRCACCFFVSVGERPLDQKTICRKALRLVFSHWEYLGEL